MDNAVRISDKPAKVTFPVVGIGASAGGYPALIALLQNLGSDPGMAIVVVLHLPRDYRSDADKVLQRSTTLPVIMVTHTMPILPGHVYIIPPSRALMMEDGKLILGDLPQVGRLLAIDLFFHTLADAHAERAIAIVLSGLGSDGAAGLAAVRAAGGVTIVQLPSDADEPEMPDAAIDSGMADFVMAAAHIPAKLADLRDGLKQIRLHAEARGGPHPRLFDIGPDPDAAFAEVLKTVQLRTGHDFHAYQRSTLKRRIERRLQVRQLVSLSEYVELLHRDKSESKAFLKDMLSGTPRFFRDRREFLAVERLLPRLFESGDANVPVRAWVTPCSTGEEAYTLAMLLSECSERFNDRLSPQIFASDIEESVLDQARAGIYPAAIASDVSPARLQRHFMDYGAAYRVQKSLRDLITFSQHDLLRNPPFCRLDLISCRNLLINLKRTRHRQLLQAFHFALKPGGYLILGNAESASAAPELFVQVDNEHHIYQRTDHPRRALPLVDTMGALRTNAPIRTVDTRSARMFSYAEIHQQKIVQFAFPSILIDAGQNILHISADAPDFLYQSGGEPTRNLAALILPELRLALHAALLRAQQGEEYVRTDPLSFVSRGQVRTILLHVRSFEHEHVGTSLRMVQFSSVNDETSCGTGNASIAPLRTGDALQESQAGMTSAFPPVDDSANQLRVYSEELQTTVDELRFAFDELQRKEQALQSANFELRLVNEELRVRMAEAARAHDDLNNLIVSSDIATVFLDRAMRIQRLTPRMADIFNVLPTDIGRPLPDITCRLEAPALAEEAATVFDTLQPLEREVIGKDARIYLVRVQPYRTSSDEIDGLLMTFFDKHDSPKFLHSLGRDRPSRPE